jgi:hypothetical protein
LDSISIESASVSSLSTNNESFSPALITSQPSSTSSLESSSISAFPTGIPTTQIHRTEPKLPSQIGKNYFVYSVLI